MPRQTLAPFEYDTIKFQPHPDIEGTVRARARYRSEEGGPLRNVYGKGRSEAAARADLRKNLAAKKGQHAGGSAQITPRSTVEAAAAVWLKEKQSQRPALATRTLDEYAKWIGAYISGTEYGRLTITAASNVVRGEQHLQAVANGQHKKTARGGGEGAMRSARKVLHGVMDTAHRHGAIPSPVRFRLQGRTVVDERRQVDTDRAFTLSELRKVQAVADGSASDVGDLVAFLSVMGCRISEALHGVYWDEVSLEAHSVVIRGTKSKNAVRAAKMPLWLTERLRKRAELYGTTGLVFGVTRYASKLGKPRDLSNVLETLRGVLDEAGCPWAGSHSFRRTVATMLDERGHGVGAIATLLGQDPVTTMTYIKKKAVGDAAALAFDVAF